MDVGQYQYVRHTKLERTIGKIRKQLGNYPEAACQYRYMYNEMVTRYLLIDPVLSAAGWNLHDFDETAVEWPMPTFESKRKADYVLFDRSEQPKVVIEAKALPVAVRNHPAGLEQQRAGFVKGMRSGVAVLTNGLIWNFYDLDSNRRVLRYKYVEQIDIRENKSTLRKSGRVLGNWLLKERWW